MRKKLLKALDEVDNSRFVIRNYKKNDIIFNENDLCKSVGIVLKGEISIFTYTLIEKEYTIKTVYEGEAFGDFLVFATYPYFLGHIVSRKETSICFIPKDNLIQILRTSDAFFKAYMEQLSKKALFLQRRVKILSQSSIKEKILFFLKSEIQENKTNIIYIKSKEDLAKVLNIPRPSLSRELSILKKDGIIDYDRNKIVVRVDLNQPYF